MKVLLVDHHLLFREGIASLLNAEPDIDVVGEANYVREATQKVQDLHPDLILMEIGAEVLDGLDAIQAICTSNPESSIILLTNHDPDNLLVPALRAGVKGYISKDSSIEKVLASIRCLQRGEVALSRRMTRRALDLLLNNNGRSNHHQHNFGMLTSREMDVIQLLATGASNRTIANELSISENTVKIHVHKILKKLNVRNRREAAHYARQNGIISEKNYQDIFHNGNWKMY